MELIHHRTDHKDNYIYDLCSLNNAFYTNIYGQLMALPCITHDIYTRSTETYFRYIHVTYHRPISGTTWPILSVPSSLV